MTREDAEEMFALGIPVEFIAVALGKTESAVRNMFRHVRRPVHRERLHNARLARLDRIRANIAATPSQPMFYVEDVAA